MYIISCFYSRLDFERENDLSKEEKEERSERKLKIKGEREKVWFLITSIIELNTKVISVLVFGKPLRL